ncbi:MAG: hypothetical protein GX773_07445, partial [Chloroflexi bacterium]|nr:hypothetical protein [Chloroflexota bacterium]
LTLTQRPSLALTKTPQRTPTAEWTKTPAPSPASISPTPSFPENHFISPIMGHVQSYELGCEASAAVDWAGFFGLAIYEYTFQTALPLSDNPNFGFVGEVTTDAWGQIPPYAYGVHAGPIADLLVEFGLPAKAVSAYTLDEIKEKLSDDKPIIVWVIGNMEYSEPLKYIDKEGRTAIVAPYEHVVILTGYNQTHLRYMNNGKFYDTPIEVFLNSWAVLGNMAVIYD